MNILFFTVEFISQYAGGVERVCYNLNESFGKNGYNSIACSLRAGKEESNNFTQQFCLPDNQNIASEANVKFLTDIIETHNIDIIFNHSFHIRSMLDLIVKTKERCSFKLVTVFHTDVSASLKELRDNYSSLRFKYSGLKLIQQHIYGCVKYPIGYYLRCKSESRKLQYLYNESDAFVLLSKFYIPTLMRRIEVDNPSKLYAINNSINENDLPKGNIIGNKRKNQILFVGRMEFQKRADRLLDIWARLHIDYPKWELIIIGDGVASSCMKEYAKKLRLERVKFLGSVPSTNYYAESKILCMTSSYEGFPMVLTEAQQHGCIPIAYESYEAIRDIIDHGVNGYLISPFKKSVFVEQLKQLMGDDKLREEVSKNAIASVAKFASKTITKQWLDLFNKLT